MMRFLTLDLPVSHYPALSGRARFLQLTLGSRRKQIKNLVIDSTGLKLYGEGEGRVRQHGRTKQRTWRKLHLEPDADTHDVTAALITNKDVVDPRGLPHLLKQLEVPVERVLAEGSYDERECCQAVYQRGARAFIPPRKGSVLWKDEYLRDSNSNLRQVEKLGTKGGRRKVKYHRRSLGVGAIFRFKTIFSEKLRAREVERPHTKVTIRCLALKRMTELGMPESYAL